jgi:nanoRNase/pAp phosphatase (c-di-AMP/oligoRNAs hydrolase)
MHRPDLPAEIADLLIRLESAEAVLCYGYSEDTLYLSMRTKRRQHDAGKIVQKIVAHLGKAGGHGTMAGGQISLNDYPLETAVAEIKQRFLSQLHEPGPGEPLLRPRAET